MATFRNIKNMTRFQFVFLSGTFIKLNDWQAMGENGKRITVNPNDEIKESNESHNRNPRKRDRKH